MKKLNYIQQWRGIAIILVLLAHSAHHNISKTIENPIVEKLVWFGGHGVTLFFILSAFTLCYVQGNGNDLEVNKRAFYIKRFFRIAPLFYLGLIFYNFIILKNIGVNEDLFLNIIFLSWLKPSAVRNGVPGGWSITTEFTFYYVFPFIYALLISRKNTVRWLLISILSSRILTAIYFRIYPGLPAYMYELNPLVQFPVFFIGILLYQKIENQLQKIEVVDYLMMAAIIALEYLFIGFVLRDYIIYAVMFSLLIYCNSKIKINLRPINWILSVIGELSFTIYITHFSVNLFLITKYFKFEDGSVTGLIARFSTLLGVSIIISLPVYYFLEKPMIKLGKTLANRSKKVKNQTV